MTSAIQFVACGAEPSQRHLVDPSPVAIAASDTQGVFFHLAGDQQVELAPGSAITISAIPGHPAGVELIRGEAAFKLSRTPSPLVVLAGPLATVADDPGTSFVVRVYPGDTLADLLVDQGFVTSTHRAASPAADSLVVSGGSRARAAQGGFLAITPDVAPDSFTLIPLGTLRDSRAIPLREVLSRIQRRYGVTVDLASPDLGERQLLASFQGDEAPGRTLEVIAAALGLEVVKGEDCWHYLLRNAKHSAGPSR